MIGRRHYGHAVMNSAEEIVRFGRDDSEAVERSSRIVPRSPAFPNFGKGERRMVAARDQTRLLRRIPLAPLIIAVGGNKTVPLLGSAANAGLSKSISTRALMCGGPALERST